MLFFLHHECDKADLIFLIILDGVYSKSHLNLLRFSAHIYKLKCGYAVVGQELYRKVPKFSDARNFAVIHLNSNKERLNLKVILSKIIPIE